MLKDYKIYLPSVPGDISEEWEQCRSSILESTKSGNRSLKLSIFVSVPDYSSYKKAREFIGESILGTFGESCPAYSITIHPPESPWKIAVEGLFISALSPEVTSVVTKFRHLAPYVVVRTKSVKEVWGAGLGNANPEEDTKTSAGAAFDLVKDILEQEEMSMNNIVRQWNYIGNILEVKNGNQNYQLFNEVRNEYYKKYRTITGYPAATGIGMKLGGVIIDFCAIAADETLKIKAVDNPNQLNAYKYDQKVLKGLKEKGQTAKHPPQFERALLIVKRKSADIIISGTASIIGQKTIGKGDIKEQTLVTIENTKETH